MKSPTKEDILHLLDQVIDPLTNEPITKGNKLAGFIIRGHHVGFSIEIHEKDRESYKDTLKKAEDIIKTLPDIESVTIALTAHTTASTPPHKDISLQMPDALHNIQNIIAIASGKGGVGKSTITAQLALSLAKKKYRVGILDADIYGPSMAKIFHIKEKISVDSQHRLLPIITKNISIMSMAFLTRDTAPTIWRGPMVSRAVTQFLQGVKWDKLDFLLIDLPPGTGDIHLSLCQKASLTGAIIVSTPQELSLIDAKKGLKMFEKVRVPIIGMIENMSYFQCNHCESITEVFSHGNVQKEAKELSVPFLGKLPLDPQFQSLDILEKNLKELPIHKNFENIVENILDNIKNTKRHKKKIIDLGS